MNSSGQFKSIQIHHCEMVNPVASFTETWNVPAIWSLTADNHVFSLSF
jgi:hypothetical protein